MCQRITLYDSGVTGFLLKEDEAKTKCSSIINLSFVGVLVDILLIACILILQSASNIRACYLRVLRMITLI